MKHIISAKLLIAIFLVVMLVSLYQNFLEQAAAAEHDQNTVLSNRDAASETCNLEEVQKAIAQKGADWQAAENWLTRLATSEQQLLFNAVISGQQKIAGKKISIERENHLPNHFDWRDQNGDWLTPVKNQGLCGASQIFAALAMTESWWKIVNNTPDATPDFSEQFLLSCAEVGGCEGGHIEEVLEQLRETGVPLEECFPYREMDTVPCENGCENWHDQAIQIPGWGWVTDFQNDVQLLKSALVKQPLLAWLWIYNDFVSYKSGIYERTLDELIGVQSVLLIGWDDANEYWICKNSWGEDWGEDGYVRIKWGECALGQNVLMIHDEYADVASLSFNPQQIDVSLAFGDSTTGTLELYNAGSKDIICHVQSYASGIEEMFRVSDFMAYDSLSLQYGIPELKRYHRTCLSFLDLPLLDLTSSNHPTLSFMTQWYMCLSRLWREEQYSDGFNVWISKDAGKTFALLQPRVGAYNTNSLAPIEMYCQWPNSPWRLDTDVLSGWVDIRPYWHAVEFDLSPYQSTAVLIRISCLSSGDRGLFILDDVPPQYGAFLDEITVKDGDTILFENHGENLTGCTRMSISYDQSFNWIFVQDNPLEIPAGTDASLKFQVDTRQLEPGTFRGYIGLTTNEPNELPDIAPADYYVPINLFVDSPESDIAVLKVAHETPMPCMGLSDRFGAILENIGKNEMRDVRLACEISSPRGICSDTLDIASIKSHEKREIFCSPFVLRETGEYGISIRMLQHPDDANDFNNQASSSVNVGTTIDNFDVDSSLWSYSGGFGITDKMNARSVPNAMHVNGGLVPYPQDMNATMILQKPLHIGIFSEATLKYWIRGMSEADKDVLSTEVSTDGKTWKSVDSVSGSIISWQQRQINISPFIASDSSRLWLRFHFVSDEQTGQLGFVIDDVEIVKGLPTSVCQSQPETRPSDYVLYQNYPNPFNPSTTIRFSLPKKDFVTLEVLNTLGQTVMILASEILAEGSHSYTWTAGEFPSGVYFYRLTTADFIQTRKMLLVR